MLCFRIGTYEKIFKDKKSLDSRLPLLFVFGYMLGVMGSCNLFTIGLLSTVLLGVAISLPIESSATIMQNSLFARLYRCLNLPEFTGMAYIGAWLAYLVGRYLLIQMTSPS